MKVYRKVALITFIIFIIILGAIFSDEATRDNSINDSSEYSSSSKVDTVSPILEKELSLLVNPFSKVYYSSVLSLPIKYLDGYNVNYKSDSSYVNFDRINKTCDIIVPSTGEERVTVTVSVSLDDIVKSKDFSFIIFGKTEIFFDSYFEGDDEINTISIKNNIDKLVDLSKYTISIVVNGDGSVISKNLNGYLRSGESLYFSTGSIYTQGLNYYDEFLYNFDGDDTIYLYDSGILIDVIGRSGLDLSNKSLTRKEDVLLPIFGFDNSTWEDKVYRINFVVDSLLDDVVTGEYGQNIPEKIMKKTGYTFNGFYLDSQFTTKFTATKFSNYDITVYGEWIKD